MTNTIATLIWFAGLVGWYIIRRPFERKARKMRVKTSLMDRQEWILLACMTIGLFVIPVINALTGFPKSLDRPFDAVIAWVGLVPLVSALWLFRRSHLDLGRNWSVTLKVREHHVLVKAGVYRLVRHPMYSSFFLLGFAQLLLLSNWLAGLSGLAGVGLLFACRVMREERMMLDSFGDEYRTYMAGTKRLIPWVL
jgi:protein-S-isoprenylcysteine O-methyltransferase Ste14